MNLKDLRKENGLSQAELAAHLGVTQATLSGWENEKYDIDNETLKKISALFNVSIDYILGNTATEEKTLSAEEEKLLRLYNSADAYGKETILLFAEREAARK